MSDEAGVSSREGNVVDNNGGVGASEQTTTFTTYPSSLPAYEDTPAELREEYQSQQTADEAAIPASPPLYQPPPNDNEIRTAAPPSYREVVTPPTPAATLPPQLESTLAASGVPARPRPNEPNPPQHEGFLKYFFCHQGWVGKRILYLVLFIFGVTISVTIITLGALERNDPNDLNQKLALLIIVLGAFTAFFVCCHSLVKVGGVYCRFLEIRSLQDLRSRVTDNTYWNVYYLVDIGACTWIVAVIIITGMGISTLSSELPTLRPPIYLNDKLPTALIVFLALEYVMVLYCLIETFIYFVCLRMNKGVFEHSQDPSRASNSGPPYSHYHRY